MEPSTVPHRAEQQLNIIWHPSPNFGPRRDGARPDHIVLHYTAMDCAEKARDWLCNEEAQVSAHYVISETGTVWQLVDEAKRAWHAGAGQWGGITDMNSRSIGIEISNTGSQPFSEPQMTALETLMTGIMDRWPITPERVIGHSDMAPGRKIDPGRRFDWRRLALRGLAIWPEMADDADDFYQSATRFGFGVTDENREQVLDAFRMRFRPHAEGPLFDDDAKVMAALARAWPNQTYCTS